MKSEHTSTRLSAYLAECFLPSTKRSAKTISNYKMACEHFIAMAGDIPMDRVTPELLAEFALWLRQEKGFAEPTIRSHIKRVATVHRHFRGESRAKRDNNGQLALSNDMARRIRQIAALYADGARFTFIAKQYGVTSRAVLFWLEEHNDEWQQALAEAMTASIERIHQQAGGSKRLEGVEGFARRAEHADRWLASRGGELFARPADGRHTLASFFAEYYAPVCLGDAQPNTLRVYQVVLRRWRLFTGNPALEEITNATVAKFRDALLQLPGLRDDEFSPNTVRGYMTMVQAILDRAAPPNRWNRDGAGVIENAPYAKPPRQVRRIPKIVPMEHLLAAYHAADEMKVPALAECSPGDWWRALLVFVFNTGIRRGTLFKLAPDHIRWSDCVVRVPARITKSFKEQESPLNAATIEHLKKLNATGRRLFSWPYCQELFGRRLKDLQGLAGIPEAHQFGLHALRRTHATYLWMTAPEAATHSLGHTSSMTTIKHYIAGQSIVAKAVANLPQPWAADGERGQA